MYLWYHGAKFWNLSYASDFQERNQSNNEENSNTELNDVLFGYRSMSPNLALFRSIIRINSSGQLINNCILLDTLLPRKVRAMTDRTVNFYNAPDTS